MFRVPPEQLHMHIRKRFAIPREALPPTRRFRVIMRPVLCHDRVFLRHTRSASALLGGCRVGTRPLRRGGSRPPTTFFVRPRFGGEKMVGPSFLRRFPNLYTGRRESV